MDIMDIITWLVVGLVAGVLASMIVGGSGYGILGDIVVGIVGAFIGGYVFTQAGWHTPFSGLAGTIFVAFIGAVILLVILHLIHGASVRRRPLV
ncbi:MAG: Transglycosylase-associated protein [Myxococcales bacterium]|nr:Transglycosylase-associated protein [Myxococcales bacterium]